MKIALDYDNTYTADPELWDMFIIMATARGHEVHIVTMRHPEDDTISDVTIPIIYCDGAPKRRVAQDAGHFFDIWIDDTPEGIVNGSTYTFVELERWRENERVDVAK